jgi:hypothetical protein
MFLLIFRGLLFVRKKVGASGWICGLPAASARGGGGAWGLAGGSSSMGLWAAGVISAISGDQAAGAVLAV